MTDTVLTTIPEPSSRFHRVRNRYGWVGAVALLLVLMFCWQAFQLPRYGGFQIRTITAGSLSLALLAMSQAVVVISGGINIAVGSLMVFVNCLSARLMEGQSTFMCVLIALFAVLVSMLISTLMGWIITVSGVPDIVITLALSFTLGGAALLILRGPGGGTDPTFASAIVGGFANPLPSILWLVGAFVLIWIPFSRSRWGLAVYAIGGNRPASFLAGVNVARTRMIAYALSGVFAGLAGVVTTAFTASGEPRASIGLAALLNSVAAVVLGGVALAGGRGGLLGPVLAAFVLTLIPPIMLGLGFDPNYAEVARGAIIIAVVMAGGLIQLRRGQT